MSVRPLTIRRDPDPTPRTPPAALVPPTADDLDWGLPITGETLARMATDDGLWTVIHDAVLVTRALDRWLTQQHADPRVPVIRRRSRRA